MSIILCIDLLYSRKCNNTVQNPCNKLIINLFVNRILCSMVGNRSNISVSMENQSNAALTCIRINLKFVQNYCFL